MTAHFRAPGLAWRAFLDDVRGGRDPLGCIGCIVNHTMQMIFAHRYICGQEDRNDLLSKNARDRHGFEQPGYLADSTNDDTPIPDQVAFSIDFASWRAGLDDQDRDIIDDLAEGYKPHEVQRRRGLNRQTLEARREVYRRIWQRLQGEVA